MWLHNKIYSRNLGLRTVLMTHSLLQIGRQCVRIRPMAAGVDIFSSDGKFQASLSSLPNQPPRPPLTPPALFSFTLPIFLGGGSSPPRPAPPAAGNSTPTESALLFPLSVHSASSLSLSLHRPAPACLVHGNTGRGTEKESPGGQGRHTQPQTTAQAARRWLRPKTLRGPSAQLLPPPSSLSHQPTPFPCHFW